MRAISPVIATIIIIAVAVALAIALVGWVMGIWGTFTGGTETLQILPDSVLNSGGTLDLHVVNKGSAAAVIYKVEIVGVDTIDTTVTITPGQDTTVSITYTGTVVAGTAYTIKVYTQAGNVYSVTLVAQ